LTISGALLIVTAHGREFIAAIGHALVIAGVLAATVDRFVKERFLREVSWDVAKYLIGYNLPPEVHYRQSIAFERWQRATITEMRCDSDDQRAAYFFTSARLGDESIDERGVFEAFGKRMRIPPHNAERGMNYRVAGRFWKILPDNSSDVISFASPTINVTLMVEIPSGFEFVAPKADVQTANRWEYRRLFLPGEHLRVRWIRQERQEAERVAER
jgi:hypothetical protein